MLDKVEVRIPAETQFSKEFACLYRDCAGDPKLFHQSRHYVRAGDLRKVGHPAILHMYCQHDKAGNHKLELIDTGEMSYRDVQREIMRIFEIDPWHLGLMRIDLAADVPGIPVQWFARNARVKWKQWIARIGKIEYAEMGRRKVETVYFGKRPNCFRIYDKISELRHQYDEILRRASDAEVPSFSEMFKYPETGFTLTRLERQIAGGRVPERINTIGKLRFLAEFNPFEALELHAGDYHEPDIDQYGIIEYFAGLGLRAKVDEVGMQETRAIVSAHSRGNTSRIFRRFASFLPGGNGISIEQLKDRYEQSIRRQLAA